MAAALETRTHVKHFGALTVANNDNRPSSRARGRRSSALTAPARRPSSTYSPARWLRPRAGHPQRRGYHRSAAVSSGRARARPDFSGQSTLPQHDAARSDGAGGRPTARGDRPLVAASCEIRAVIEEAAELLDRLRLLDCAHEPTGTLSYGRQRLLEIALALALHPRVLLLDEPAAGVPEGEGVELYATLAELPRRSRYCSSSTIWTWSFASPATSPCSWQARSWSRELLSRSFRRQGAGSLFG